MNLIRLVNLTITYTVYPHTSIDVPINLWILYTRGRPIWGGSGAGKMADFGFETQGGSNFWKFSKFLGRYRRGPFYFYVFKNFRREIQGWVYF